MLQQQPNQPSHRYFLASYFMFLVFFVATMGACSNAAKEATTGKTATFPLAVTTTVPSAEASFVPPNTMITVLFSGALEPSTFNANSVKIYKAQDPNQTQIGESSFSYENEVGVIQAPLVAEQRYVVVIGTAVKDVNGRAMLKKYQWVFTTGTEIDSTPPTVQLNSPATDKPTPLNPNFIFRFSEQVDLRSISILLDDQEIVTNGKALLPYTLNFNLNSLSITPQLLKAEQTFKITLKSTLKDLAGQSPAADFSWQFTTGLAPDKTAPKLSSTSPADGAKELLRDIHFLIKVSEPLNEATVGNNTVYLQTDGSGDLVNISVYYDAAGQTILIHPKQMLRFGVSYLISLSGITDTAGNPLSTPVLLYTIEIDTDKDGMPDRWEKLYTGLDPNVADGARDIELAADGLTPSPDGLVNVQEFEYNSNPNRVDTDGDGISDGVEVNNGRSPTVNEPVLLGIINSLLLSDVQ